MAFPSIFMDFHAGSWVFMGFHGFSWVFIGENIFWTVLDHFDHGDPHGPMDPWCGILYIRYGGVPYITHSHGIH